MNTAIKSSGNSPISQNGFPGTGHRSANLHNGSAWLRAGSARLHDDALPVGNGSAPVTNRSTHLRHHSPRLGNQSAHLCNHSARSDNGSAFFHEVLLSLGDESGCSCSELRLAYDQFLSEYNLLSGDKSARVANNNSALPKLRFFRCGGSAVLHTHWVF